VAVAVIAAVFAYAIPQVADYSSVWAVLATPRRDVAVTTTVLALAALVVNEPQRRWGARRPGQPAGAQVPDTARRAGLR